MCEIHSHLVIRSVHRVGRKACDNVFKRCSKDLVDQVYDGQNVGNFPHIVDVVIASGKKTLKDRLASENFYDDAVEK